MSKKYFDKNEIKITREIKTWLIITCIMVALWPVIVHTDVERISGAYPWFIISSLIYACMVLIHENDNLGELL